MIPFQKIESEIYDALRGRNEWERRLATWYQMRNRGIPRRVKPWPNAADLHFPLADSFIEKAKAYYINAPYQGEVLVNFVCTKGDQDTAKTTAAMRWFDYQLKQRSNFEMAHMWIVDAMLVYGRPVLKPTWDDRAKKLRYGVVQPQHIIVPIYTEELQDADWLVHVQHLSEAQYRANPQYLQDDSLIESMKSWNKGQLTGTAQNLTLRKERREGITHVSAGDRDHTLVLWEVWHRDDEGKWLVTTVSPAAFQGGAVRDAGDKPTGHEEPGSMARPIKPTMANPYNHGRLPFVDFPQELTESRWYSPRGLVEIVAPFEASLCKTWNQKHDFLDMTALPLLSTDSAVPNPSAIQLRPGVLLPFGVKQNPISAPPLDLNREMDYMRETAEYRVNLPDFGRNDTQTGGEVTATERKLQAASTAATSGTRNRIHRKALAEVYQQSWALLVQFLETDFNEELGRYLYQQQAQTMTVDALHADYMIEPWGSADDWDPETRMKKAGGRMQMFWGNPYINQGELTRSALESDDPRLVPKLYVDPTDQASDQQEDQVVEIGIMITGFPARVKQTDDDIAHLVTIGQWLAKTLPTGQVGPELAVHIEQHALSHLQAAAQKKDPRAQQIAQQAQPFMAALAQIIQTAQTQHMLAAGAAGQGMAPQPQQMAA